MGFRSETIYICSLIKKEIPFSTNILIALLLEKIKNIPWFLSINRLENQMCPSISNLKIKDWKNSMLFIVVMLAEEITFKNLKKNLNIIREEIQENWLNKERVIWHYLVESMQKVVMKFWDIKNIREVILDCSLRNKFRIN